MSPSHQHVGARYLDVVGRQAKSKDQDIVPNAAPHSSPALAEPIDVASDIRPAEALLQESALQSAIFNSANFSSIATDANGVIQIFNVGAERMLGYTAAEVMNRITPADISEPQEVIARARALSLELQTPIAPGFEALVFKASRGIEDIYELTYIRKDGSRFPAVVSVTALRDAQDAIIGYLLIGTDNTARQQVEEERKKLDQRLRDQHFYTRSLIESNIDALMATDPRGIITDVNKQAEALTGCTRDELIGAPFRNHFTEPDLAEAGINRVLTEGTVTNYELTARARSGRLTTVSYNATTFYDRDRILQGVFAAARDVTELRRFEQTLQQKNVELEEASRMKSEFLANMSHELRTPLNAIIGFSALLRDGLMGELTGQQRGSIGDILSSGKHLLSLINDILDLSKVEAGKGTLALELVPVSSFLASSLSIVREKAMTRQIRLEIQTTGELGSLLADSRKVRQILYNLLSNAVKFTGDGGLVTLCAGRVTRAAVGQVSGPWQGRRFPVPENEFAEFIEISVADSGIGISHDGLQRLFQPFSQIDSGLARKFDGTGLGLALVKLLVELHGGTVAVASCVGRGSRFTVWLPVRPIEDAVAALPAADDTDLAADHAPGASGPTFPEPSPGVHRAAKPAKVLVVEDNAANMRFAQFLLNTAGHLVLTATDAETALTLARAEQPALILMDIQLPGMDGLAATALLKHDAVTRAIPVIALTALAMKGDEERIRVAGCDGYIAKPMRHEEFLAVVAAQLARA